MHTFCRKSVHPNIVRGRLKKFKLKIFTVTNHSNHHGCFQLDTGQTVWMLLWILLPDFNVCGNGTCAWLFLFLFLCTRCTSLYVSLHVLFFFKASSHKQAPGWALLSEEANWNYCGSFIRKMCPSGGHPLTEGEANCSLSLCVELACT